MSQEGKPIPVGVEFVTKGSKPVPVKVKVVVKESKPTPIHVEFVASDEGRRRLLVQQALKELAAFRRKYAMLHELTSVLEAIDRAQAELSFEAA